MSYFTHVRILYWGDDTVTPDVILPVARQHIERRGYAVEDVTSDLARGLTQGRTEFSDLRSELLTDLFRLLSRQFPKVNFAVSGMGEEPRDIWHREFLGGKMTFKRGPFL